jgi:hypothetical protein
VSRQAAVAAPFASRVGALALAASALAGCYGELVPVECSIAGDAYTPFSPTGGDPITDASELPWRGGGAGDYPDGVEDFRGYSGLPEDIECSTDKSRRSHIDVTEGCLEAIAGDGAEVVGRVRSVNGHFRAVALGYAAGAAEPGEWTDAAVEYRFLAPDAIGTGGENGFKAFVRYRSEDDLLVASWRFDGVVQIQHKGCGRYLVLARKDDQPPPTLGTWHTMRFSANGSELELSLDGAVALTAETRILDSGTVGIRIDARDGVLIDDWRVTPP